MTLLMLILMTIVDCGYSFRYNCTAHTLLLFISHRCIICPYYYILRSSQHLLNTFSHVLYYGFCGLGARHRPPSSHEGTPSRVPPAARLRLHVGTFKERGVESRNFGRFAETAICQRPVEPVVCFGRPLRFRLYFSFFSKARICIWRIIFLDWGIACRIFEIVASHSLHQSVACPYPKGV